MAYKIYVSSTRGDIEIAKDVANRIAETGVKVFPVDETAVPGDYILTKANRALREADEVVMILTRDSVNSPALISEIGMMMALEKIVTPIGVNIAEDNLPPMLKSFGWLKFAELPKYLDGLAQRTRAAKTA